MQQLVIIGNLTGDPVTKSTKSGAKVCAFTVAVNGRKAADGTENAAYFRVSAWEKLAELCQKYLAKGRKVCVVSNNITARAYTTQSGELRASLEVTAREVEFLSPRAEQAAPEAEPQTEPGGYTQVDEDVPF